MGEQLERRVVCPVQVVQGEDHRLAGGEELEQRAHRVVQAVALVLLAGGRRHVE
jgi:hypothetical protein